MQRSRMAALRKPLFLVFLAVILNGLSAFDVTGKNDAFEPDDHIDDVIANVMNQDDNLQPAVIDKRAVQGECNDQLKFPESPSIVKENNKKTIDASSIWFTDLAQYNCQPRLFSVNIPAQSHMNIYPTAVMLKRCYGATSFVQVCMATKKENVKVKYLEAGTWLYHHADMWEHTECQSMCKSGSGDCNKDQTFDSNRCECMCKLPSNHNCNDPTRIWSHDKCKCQCRVVTQCGVYKEWDPENCKCRCAKCLRDLCISRNLVINESTCSC